MNLKRLRRAAQRGDRDAQFELGCAYLRGEGVRKNRVIGLKWMILASDQGDLDADVQCQLVGAQLSEMQERRAVAAALKWKFGQMLKGILEQLLRPETTVVSNDEDDLPVYVKLPDRLN